MGSYYVYIVASVSRILYVGVTNDLERRVYEHRRGESAGFTNQYHVSRLVYCEEFADPSAAIAREKQIKNWWRAKKVALIEEKNPEWRDLSADWYT